MADTVIHQDTLVTVTQDSGGSFHWYATSAYNASNERTVTDGATTNLSPTLTSATAAFVAGTDNGKFVSGAGIPAGTTITVVNATTATMSANATATASGVTVLIGAPGVTPVDETGAPIYGDDGIVPPADTAPVDGNLP